jgi:hypothetical protein
MERLIMQAQYRRVALLLSTTGVLRHMINPEEPRTSRVAYVISALVAGVSKTVGALMSVNITTPIFINFHW